MRVYHMIIEREFYFEGSEEAKQSRKEYMSIHQGSAPKGWRCVGVCGYHDTPKGEWNENESNC